MRSVLSAALVIGVLGLSAMPARAHHAFAAEFDINRPVEIKGTVTKVEWINPHSWIHVSVSKPDGTAEVWAVEAGTPNTLLRRGLKKADLPLGMAIRVTGYQAKDGSSRANGSNISLPDGRNLFLGSSGTGAPPPPSN